MYEGEGLNQWMPNSEDAEDVLEEAKALGGPLREIIECAEGSFERDEAGVVMDFLGRLFKARARALDWAEESWRTGEEAG